MNLKKRDTITASLIDVFSLGVTLATYHPDAAAAIMRNRDKFGDVLYKALSENDTLEDVIIGDLVKDLIKAIES